MKKIWSCFQAAKSCDLKKQKSTQIGEIVTYKLALDIYVNVSVLDVCPFEDIVYVLYAAIIAVLDDTKSSQIEAQTCRSELKVLIQRVAELKADILILQKKRKKPQ